MGSGKIVMKRLFVIGTFGVFGAALELAAMYVGIAFTGFKDFGNHWICALIYFVGLLPDRALPNWPVSSPWSSLDLVFPIFVWGVIGTAFVFLLMGKSN
jgi:hypothetical protein